MRLFFTPFQAPPPYPITPGNSHSRPRCLQTSQMLFLASCRCGCLAEASQPGLGVCRSSATERIFFSPIFACAFPPQRHGPQASKCCRGPTRRASNVTPRHFLTVSRISTAWWSARKRKTCTRELAMAAQATHEVASEMRPRRR